MKITSFEIKGPEDTRPLAKALVASLLDMDDEAFAKSMDDSDCFVLAEDDESYKGSGPSGKSGPGVIPDGPDFPDSSAPEGEE